MRIDAAAELHFQRDAILAGRHHEVDLRLVGPFGKVVQSDLPDVRQERSDGALGDPTGQVRQMR